MTAPAASKAEPYARAKARYLEHLEERRRFHADTEKRIAGAIERVADSDWSTPRQIFSIVPRKRDRQFVERGLANMSKGMEPEKAFSLAARDTWRFTTDEATLVKAKQKLNQPEVCLAIELAVEAATGFRLEDALKWQVAHIQGEVVKQTVIMGKDGAETIDVKMPPSYAALRDYLGMVTPKQTTKIVTAHFDVNEALKAKPEDQEPRFVGPVIESKGSEEEDYTEETLRDLAEEEDDE